MTEGNDSRGVVPGCQTEADAVLVALAHPYRRFVLEYLGEPGETATITEVAAAISNATSGPDPLVDRTTSVDSVETALYHVHVPKLTEVDLLNCDDEVETVTLSDRWHDVQPILQAVSEVAH